MSENSINQSQLSKEAKIPRTTISGWMNAGRLPDYDAIKTLAEYFNISSDELLGLKEYGFVTETNFTPLSVEEKKLIEKYRAANKETKKLIEKILTE